MPTKKLNHFLAIRDTGMMDNGRDLPSRIFDMLRYDACYPVSNAPDGFVVLCQPYRKDMKGGFTLARWESFGFTIAGRNGSTPIIVDSGPVEYGASIPHNLRVAMSRIYSK